MALMVVETATLKGTPAADSIEILPASQKSSKVRCFGNSAYTSITALVSKAGQIPTNVTLDGNSTKVEASGSEIVLDTAVKEITMEPQPPNTVALAMLVSVDNAGQEKVDTI